MSTFNKKATLRRIVSFLVVICMMFGVMPSLALLTVNAEAPATYTTIVADSTASVTISSSGDAQYFEFVPTFNGQFRFYSTDSNSDPYGALLDADGNRLISNDDYDGLNFSFTYDCEANTTYYVKAYMFSSNTGYYTLNVETIEIYCEHDYVLQSTTVADCENDGISTYVCSLCGHSYEDVVPALGHDYADGVCTRCGAENNRSKTILLVENVLCWGYDSNVMVLTQMVEDGYILDFEKCDSSDILSGRVCMDDYSVVVFAHQQSDTLYDDFNNILSEVEEYVSSGGVVVISLCYGKLSSYTLPGNVTVVNDSSNYNFIADYSNSIVTGSQTDGNALTDEDLYDNSFSHAAFTNLPSDAHTILVGENDLPTLVDYPIGAGYMLVSGLVWEWAYEYSHSYARAYDDYFLYALSLADAVTPCIHTYEETSRIDATCTTEGLIVYVCSECGREREEIIPSLGHGYVESVIEVGCENDGVYVYTCSRCGDSYEEVYQYAYGHYYEDGYCTNCGEYMFADVTVVASGESVYVDDSGYAYFSFTPTQSGEYRFYSTDYSGDPYAELYDSYGNYLTSDHDGGYDWNFSISYVCEANTTYYIRAYNYGEYYTFNVETIEIYCDHDYVLQSTTPVDCENDGVEIYACSLCGDSYENILEYAYGHYYENGYCINCGEHVIPEFTVIGTDSNAYVEIVESYGCVYFKFVPTVSGQYRFYSTDNSSDTYGTLLDANGDYLTHNDDGGSGSNFSIYYDCEANTTYYIKAHMWSDCTGYYTFNVETIEIYCDHEYVLQSATPVDCETDGVEIYACSLCGDSYENIVEYAYGHCYESGYCINCGEYLFADATVVVSGDSVYVDDSGYVYFSFTPTASGQYRFYSTDYSGDPYVELYDSYGNYLTGDDDSGTSRNFSIYYDCEANTTYYICAYNYSGYYTFNVETIEIYCDHEYVLQSATPVDCENDGISTYVCTICGYTYDDVTPAWGHDYVGGFCANCGVEEPEYVAISEYNSYTGDVFLGGRYIELGISIHGSFGTRTSPSTPGFHSDGSLGMIVDGDGWDYGNAPTTGDFFLPDSPEERYIFSYVYNGTTYQYKVGDRVNVMYGTWNVVPTVSNQSSGSLLKAVVYGVTQHNIGLEITYSFEVNDKNFKTSVRIINESGVDITDVRFVRSFDPDQDDDIYNTNDTYNKVLANPDSARPGDNTNYAMVVARGRRTLEGFFFVAFDNRAYASQGVAFAPDSAYLSGLWNSSHSYPTYATDESIFMSHDYYNGYSCDDTGIAITFNLNTISASGQDYLEYYSSMSPNVEEDLDDILPSKPTINSVSGAQIYHNSTSGGPSIDAIVEPDHIISYQWYINEVNSNEGGIAIPGATSATYNVPNKYEVGTVEYYYCVVTATRIGNGLYETEVSDVVIVEYFGIEHEWTETSRTEATCTSDGRIEYICSCGETRVEIVRAPGHAIATTVESEVTCTTDGLIVDRCTNDGCDYERSTVIHGSHNYSITNRQDATCEIDGYIEYTCANCGDQYYEYIEGMHNYVESSRVEAQVEVEGSITYTCTYCSDSYSIVIPALTPVLKNSSVLLIQDALPWADDVNTALLEALKERGVVSSYNIINTSALATIDLSQYGVVFIANDQSTAMYERLAANADKLENYVRAGGNLIYGACDEGWSGGSLTHTLPGGVVSSNYYSVHNYIVNELHPIVTGIYTDNRSLRDELLKGNYCSHTYFDTATLPEGTDIILRDANGNPTLIEYALGDGVVIATGLTWEFFYVRDHYDMVTNYSKYAFDDLLTYMVYMSSTCEHDYEMVETVEPTCEENGYTLYVCSLCSYEYKSNIVAPTGHNYVETSRTEGTCTVRGEIVYTCACGGVVIEYTGYGDHTSSDWIVLTPATCVAGSQYKECTVCHTTLETEEIAPTEPHAFTETSRTEVTCTTDGRINYICSCGETRVEIVRAPGHAIATTVESEVTCTTDGLIVDRCMNDGCDYERSIIIHGEHNYSVTDRQEATCEIDGYIEYTCANCGDQYYEYIEGVHNYVESSRVEAQVEVEGSITYTCTYCSDSYSIVIPALTPVLKNSSVLLIQDSLPWAEDVNTALLETLKERGVVSSYNIINTSTLATIDLSQYGVVFIANDQSSAMYERLAANADKLENYVRAGGNLIYGACDNGWGGCGSLTHTLPGGVTTSNYYSVHNYIVNELHPIVTGIYTDNRSLRDELLKGNYCSHTYFDTASLPEGTDVILRDANGNPTLIEYALGDGVVIATGLTWEYFYVRDHYDMVTNYSKYAFDDLLTYMVYMSSTCEHDYEMVETAEPTCEENGYTLYVCSLCSYEYKSNIVAPYGHDYVETSRTEGTCTVRGEIVYTCACGDVKTEWTDVDPDNHSGILSDWIVVTPATCIAGVRVKEYTCCHVGVSEEIPPVSDHIASDWIVDSVPTAMQTGSRHKECTVCHTVLETEVTSILAKLEISNVEAGIGSTVRVTINIQNNPGILGAVLTLNYDPALTLINAEAGSAWSSLTLTKPAEFTNSCNFTWDGITEADYGNGTVIILTFKLPDDAAIGTVYNISASYMPGNMINADLEPVDVQIESGSITVIDLIGDVNRDGVVNVADVITLRRYIAGGYGVEIDEIAADMNSDGYITVADIVLLRRHLVG